MAAPARYLVIDQGGHASRAIVYDGTARVLGRGEVAVATRHPRRDRVEHDPQALRDSLPAAVAQALHAAATAPRQLRGVALACQRASVLGWRRSDARALSPVLSWQDRRAQGRLDAARLDVDAVQAETGMRPNAHLGASKLAWLQRHATALRGAGDDAVLGPLASFLLQGLLASAPCVAPHSFAQRMLLFATARADWSPGLCARFGLDPARLPACVPDCGEFGALRIAGVAVPLRVCAGDQNLLPAALAEAASGAVLNLGTGAFVLGAATALQTGAATPLLRTRVPLPGRAAASVLEGTINGAGSAFDWLARRARWPQPDWAALAQAPPRRRPLFLNTVGGLGSPFWSTPCAPQFDREPEDAAAAMHAVADSIGCLLRANLEAMAAVGQPVERLFAGGGLARSRALCARLADLCGCTIEVLDAQELSARGALACLLAASGEPSLPAPAVAATHRPRRQRHDADARYAAWRAAIDRFSGP